MTDNQLEQPSTGFEDIKAKPSPKIPITIGGIVLLILLIAGGAYLYRSGYSLEIGNLKLGQTPTPPSPSVNDLVASKENEDRAFKTKLERCQITSNSEHKLIRKVTDLSPQSRVIDLQGVITSITYNPSGKTSDIEITDPSGANKLSFTVTEKPSLVYDSGKLKDMVLSELKYMDQIIVTYFCNPEEQTEHSQVSRISKIVSAGS